MRCNNCGFENQQDFSFCPQCGNSVFPVAAPQSPAASTVLQALKNPLFLVICILMSVSCLLSLTADGVPLIEILLTVFLWLTYAQSRKDIADAKHLRCVSGTVYANYVINYVVAGLVLLMGVIFSVAFSFLAGDPEFLDALLSGIVDTESLAMVSGIFASVTGGVILFVCAFAAAIIIVINIFSLRYIHQFAKSVYQSIETGTLELKAAKATKNWLFVLGILSGISALSSLSGGQFVVFLSGGVSCAITIIASLLIKKYLYTEA